MIRVLIVDDHQLMRQGVRALLGKASDIEVVGEASNGHQAVDLVERLQPDIVLMDIHMPGLDGLGATEQLVARGSSARVVILSMMTDEETVRQAAQVGAKAYLFKDCSRDELTSALRSVYQGGCPCSPAVAPYFQSR